MPERSAGTEYTTPESVLSIEGFSRHAAVISDMALARSKLTAQGQISVPARIRQKLGAGPGSVLEWNDSGDNVVVRRVGRFTSEDIHRSLFPTPAKTRTVAEMKEGVRQHARTLRRFTARLPCVAHQPVTRYKRQGRA
jgi:AbrB family looped-hinge helix DNA binding protein